MDRSRRKEERTRPQTELGEQALIFKKEANHRSEREAEAEAEREGQRGGGHERGAGVAGRGLEEQVRELKGVKDFFHEELTVLKQMLQDERRARYALTTSPPHVAGIHIANSMALQYS